MLLLRPGKVWEAQFLPPGSQSSAPGVLARMRGEEKPANLYRAPSGIPEF